MSAITPVDYLKEWTDKINDGLTGDEPVPPFVDEPEPDYCADELSEKFKSAFPVLWKKEIAHEEVDFTAFRDVFRDEIKHDITNGSCMLSYMHEIIDDAFDSPYIELESPLHRVFAATVHAIMDETISTLLTVIESGDMGLLDKERSLGDLLDGDTFDRIEKIIRKMK